MLWNKEWWRIKIRRSNHPFLMIHMSPFISIIQRSKQMCVKRTHQSLIYQCQIIRTISSALIWNQTTRMMMNMLQTRSIQKMEAKETNTTKVPAATCSCSGRHASCKDGSFRMHRTRFWRVEIRNSWLRKPNWHQYKSQIGSWTSEREFGSHLLTRITALRKTLISWWSWDSIWIKKIHQVQHHR